MVKYPDMASAWADEASMRLNACLNGGWCARQAGGAINIGFDIFSSDSACATNPNPAARSVVTIDSCTVIGNIATNYGGGISVQDGILTLQARMGSTTSHHIPDSYEHMSASSCCSCATFGMLSFAKHPLFPLVHWCCLEWTACQ